MPEYSHDVLFEKFLEYLELYFELKTKLAKKRKKSDVPQEDFEELFYEEIDELERQKDLLQKVFEQYVTRMLTFKSQSDNI